MTDLVTQFFTNDMIGLLGALLICGLSLSMRLAVTLIKSKNKIGGKKTGILVDLFVSDMFFMIVSFSAWSLFIDDYGVVVLLVTSALVTWLFRQTFEGRNINTEDGVMLSFVVFFAFYSFVSPWVFSNSVHGGVGASNFSVNNLSASCKIEGGLGFFWSVGNCIYNMVLYFISFGTMSHSVFLVNVVLFGSFLTFLAMYIINKLKPGSG